MTKAAKEFLKSTTTKLDEILAALTPEEQHDLLDALAGEVEERLDQLVCVTMNIHTSPAPRELSNSRIIPT